MKKKLAFLGASALTLTAPFAAFAQTVCVPGTYAPVGITKVICTIYGIIKIIIPVLILAAVAWFIFGIVKFMTAGDEEAKTNGRGHMIHGIISFAVILGLWGLVNILLNTFGVSNQGGPGQFPTF